MVIQDILACVNVVHIPKYATITQLKREEDEEFYKVWKITADGKSYLLKESKGDELAIYSSILAVIKVGAPTLYQALEKDGKSYLFMEYIDGENLCKCTREKLIHALDALIQLQQITWDTQKFPQMDYLFEKSLFARKNRANYLLDPLLEKVYDKFLDVYQSLPKTLCHDDFLPFNVIATDQTAYLIDWEVGGILPYPTSFARLIAHVSTDKAALFYMSDEDKAFAVDYYYEHLLKGKGISYPQWKSALEYFLFYEYCEWVFVGNKYHATDGEYYQKYYPMAKTQAEKLLKIQ